MATLEIWDYGISHGEKMIKLLDPRPNDGTFQVCKTWLVSFLLRWKIGAESLWFGTWIQRSWTSLGECWIWYDMGHGISLGFGTPKELHHSNSTRGIVLTVIDPSSLDGLESLLSGLRSPQPAGRTWSTLHWWDQVALTRSAIVVRIWIGFFHFPKCPKAPRPPAVRCQGLPSDDEKLEICQVLARLKLQRLRGIVFCLSDVFFVRGTPKNMRVTEMLALD